MSFREMKDYELDGLPDEKLIDYVVRARRAGAWDAVRLGLSVFSFRRLGDITARAKRKMPTWDDAEDVASQAMRDFFRAVFEGESVGEAVNLLHRILSRRIADWHDSRKQTEQLPEDSDDDDNYSGPDAAVSSDETGLVELEEAIAKIFAKLSASHQMVVEDAVFAGFSAKETADNVNKAFPDLDPPMTESNVDQIKSRFRKDLRKELSLPES